MDDVYAYNYANKLFICSGDIDHDMVKDLKRFLKDKDQSG